MPAVVQGSLLVYCIKKGDETPWHLRKVSPGLKTEIFADDSEDNDYDDDVDDDSEDNDDSDDENDSENNDDDDDSDDDSENNDDDDSEDNDDDENVTS